MATERRYVRYDDPDYDPHEFRSVPKPTSDFETLVHILKGCLGTGIVAMPQAFSYVGTVAGCLFTLCIGILCGYLIHLLVRTIYYICKITKHPLLTYGEAIIAAFEIGPQKFRKFHEVAGCLVDMFLTVLQLGTCSVYVIFVVDNVKDVIHVYYKLDIIYLYSIFFLPFCLNIMLRNLKIMAPISMVSTITTFISFGICLYYMISDLPSFTDRPMFKFNYEFPLYFGITMFAIQGLGVIIYTENTMKNPEHFLSRCGVYNCTQSMIIFCYITIGLVGYWRYGDETKASITSNLPMEDIAPQIARLLYAFSIYASYGLQAYPAIEILLNNYVEYYLDKNHKHRLLYEYFVRFFVIIITYVVAIVVPLLTLVISLMGCFCLTALSIVLPAIMECLVRYPLRLGKFKWVIVKNIILAIFGLLCLISGTYFTIMELIKKVQERFN